MTFLIDAVDLGHYVRRVTPTEKAPDGVLIYLDDDHRTFFVLVTRAFIDQYHQIYLERDESVEVKK